MSTTENKQGLNFKTFLIIGAIIFIVYLIFSDKKTDSTKADNAIKNVAYDSDSSQNIRKTSLGQQLAYLELNKDAFIVTPYSLKLDKLITKLSVKYNEPRDTIADLTSRLLGVLKDDNITLSTGFVLEDINKIPKMENVKYRDIIALYGMTTKRESQRP